MHWTLSASPPPPSSSTTHFTWRCREELAVQPTNRGETFIQHQHTHISKHADALECISFTSLSPTSLVQEVSFVQRSNDDLPRDKRPGEEERMGLFCPTLFYTHALLIRHYWLVLVLLPLMAHMEESSLCRQKERDNARSLQCSRPLSVSALFG